jgi:hypothetical protein
MAAKKRVYKKRIVPKELEKHAEVVMREGAAFVPEPPPVPDAVPEQKLTELGYYAPDVPPEKKKHWWQR